MKRSFQKLLPFLALATVLGFTACGDDDDPVQNVDAGTVDISIQGMVAGDNLAIESATYDANNAVEGFRLSRLSFYLSDIRLVEVSNGQALETPLTDVAYFEMGPSGGTSQAFENVPTGDYTSLRFNFGLTEEQDATTPADYASTHPLGRTEEYWVDWGSYIFAKVEGKSDTLADGNERFDAPFSFHVGVAAENTRPIEVAINLPVRGESNDLSLEFDVSTLLQLNTANELPLTQFIHRGPLLEQVATNAETAFSVAD